MPKQTMTEAEVKDMTVAVAQAYVDQQAAGFERLGFTPIELHAIKDKALDRFNAWYAAVKGANETN